MDRLYHGDCLAIMRDYIQPGSVDLIYLDPPFNTNRNYDTFSDVWTFDTQCKRAIRDMPDLLNKIGVNNNVTKSWQLWIDSLRNTQPNLLAYLSYMSERLIYMWQTLKITGSIYLHCTPTASHYIKVIMDIVFGSKNFRNEIIWGYRTGGVSKRYFGRKHDVILFYTKSDEYTFNVQKEKSYNRNNKPYRFNGVTEYQNEQGRWYTMATMRDIWEINAIGRTSNERTGYPAQKPLTLLNRIISTSSDEGNLVLDPFCGSASTMEAAYRLKRRWIGIDIGVYAIRHVAKKRLSQRLRLVEGVDFVIEDGHKD